jgi:hypothetical protein
MPDGLDIRSDAVKSATLQSGTHWQLGKVPSAAVRLRHAQDVQILLVLISVQHFEGEFAIY